jgi:hypothetical protein
MHTYLKHVEPTVEVGRCKKPVRLVVFRQKGLEFHVSTYCADGHHIKSKIYQDPDRAQAIARRLQQWVRLCPTEFVGRCPLCRGQLNVEGDQVVCENGDYHTFREWFDNAWNAYENLCNQAGRELTAQPLIDELVRINHSDHASPLPQ